MVFKTRNSDFYVFKLANVYIIFGRTGEYKRSRKEVFGGFHYRFMEHWDKKIQELSGGARYGKENSEGKHSLRGSSHVGVLAWSPL